MISLYVLNKFSIISEALPRRITVSLSISSTSILLSTATLVFWMMVCLEKLQRLNMCNASVCTQTVSDIWYCVVLFDLGEGGQMLRSH